MFVDTYQMKIVLQGPDVDALACSFISGFDSAGYTW